MKHKHYTNMLRAAAELHINGWVSAHVATYQGLECSCGDRRRNTRLAASIAELRAKGIDITTKQEPGEQAIYYVDGTQNQKLEALLRLNFGF